MWITFLIPFLYAYCRVCCCCCCCSQFAPPCDAPLLDGPFITRSAPSSPSRDASNFRMPSLYQFSAVDAASAVDYSRDVGIEDGVVNSPPPKLHSRARAPSPSPLSKEKRTLVRLATTSREDGVHRRGPSRRLRMEAPAQEALTSASAPPPANSSHVIRPPCIDPPVNGPKAKVQFLLLPKHLSRRWCNCLPCLHSLVAAMFTNVHPKPPSFPPLRSSLCFNPTKFAFFRRWLLARWVPIPPRRRPWIGWHQRPRHPSLIVVSPSSEARDNPSPKRNRIPLTIPLRTIRERVRIILYGRTAHIPGPSTKMVIAAGRRFLGPWRLPKKKMWPRQKNSGTDSLN